MKAFSKQEHLKMPIKLVKTQTERWYPDQGQTWGDTRCFTSLKPTKVASVQVIIYRNPKNPKIAKLSHPAFIWWLIIILIAKLSYQKQKRYANMCHFRSSSSSSSLNDLKVWLWILLPKNHPACLNVWPVGTLSSSKGFWSLWWFLMISDHCDDDHFETIYDVEDHLTSFR